MVDYNNKDSLFYKISNKFLTIRTRFIEKELLIDWKMNPTFSTLKFNSYTPIGK